MHKNIWKHFQFKRLKKRLDKKIDRYHIFWENYYDSGLVIKEGSSLNNEFIRIENYFLNSINSLEQTINRLGENQNAN